MKSVMLWCMLALLVVLTGCKGCKEDPKPKVNEQPPLTAAFNIYDEIGNSQYEIGHFTKIRMVTDTFYSVLLMSDYSDNLVIFRAYDTTATSYEWRVGTDDRIFKNRVFALNFKVPGRFDVKLKVRRNKIDGTEEIDSLMKSFTILRVIHHPLEGKFKGFLHSKPDSIFSIYIFKGFSIPLDRPLSDRDTVLSLNGGNSYMIYGLHGQKNHFRNMIDVFTHGYYIENSTAFGAQGFKPGSNSIRFLYGFTNKRRDTVNIRYKNTHWFGPGIFDISSETDEVFFGVRYF